MMNCVGTRKFFNKTSLAQAGIISKDGKIQQKDKFI